MPDTLLRSAESTSSARDGKIKAFHLASLGLPVLGVDVAETELAIARAKARDCCASVTRVPILARTPSAAKS